MYVSARKVYDHLSSYTSIFNLIKKIKDYETFYKHTKVLMITT